MDDVLAAIGNGLWSAARSSAPDANTRRPWAARATAARTTTTAGTAAHVH